MASNVNNQEGEHRRFNLDDVLKNSDDLGANGGEEIASPDQPEGGVSMFCKACLNPYSGEAKAGTIVLKCERCGQTDVVLEEKAVDLDPEEWSGNLMMNRFLQVLKEQEDLKLNIVDPYFADDDYQHYLLAVQEYTFNMKAIAEKMYDIAYEARMACEREERLLHEALEADDDDVDQSNEQDGTKQEDNSINAAVPTSTSTKQKLKKLGATLTKLMYSIIQKHNLPSDVMDRVQYRIRHPSFSSDKGDTQEGGEHAVSDNTRADGVGDKEDIHEKGDAAVSDNTEAGGVSLGSTENSLENIDDMADDVCDNVGDKSSADVNGTTTTDMSKEAEGVEDGTSGEQDNEDILDGEEGGPPDDDLNDGEDTGPVFKAFSNDRSSSMVEAKEKIENEIFGVLKSKFKINFEDAQDEETEQNESEEDQNDMNKDSEENVTKEDKTNNVDHMTDTADHSKTDTRDVPDADNRLHSHVINEIDTIATNEPDNLDDEEDESELQVNFYSISSAFIKELQSRKRKALMERKDKALRTVHEKIVALKTEVENVENRVHDELTSAYRRKLKKVEYQRKQLDKRHETIQDVEKLMTHYARTGQNDKLAELMEQLDIQYEN